MIKLSEKQMHLLNQKFIFLFVNFILILEGTYIFIKIVII
jgi:hypothetical protein